MFDIYVFNMQKYRMIVNVIKNMLMNNTTDLANWLYLWRYVRARNWTL